MKRALILLFILVIVLGGGAWGWRHFSGAGGKAGEVETYTVAAGPVELALKETGVVQPRQTVLVKSKVSGKIREVLVAEGEKVNAGQLVAVVEPDSAALLTLSQHRMELRRLKIDLDQKQREAERQRQLRAGGLNSPQAAETAERDFKTAQNLFLQSKTTLNLLEREANQPLTASAGAEGSTAPVEMNLYRILAPIEGVVSLVKVKPGELISSGSSGFSQEGALLLEIADQRRLEVIVNINEIDIPKVNPGMIAKVTLAARPGKPIPGKVDRVAVAPITDANKLVVYPVAISLPERPPELRQGMSASVDLTLESIASTLRIPVLAYIEKEGTLRVKIKTGAGKFPDREITLGLKSDKFVEVKSGLAAGDLIAARYPKDEDASAPGGPGGMRRR